MPPVLDSARHVLFYSPGGNTLGAIFVYIIDSLPNVRSGSNPVPHNYSSLLSRVISIAWRWTFLVPLVLVTASVARYAYGRWTGAPSGRGRRRSERGVQNLGADCGADAAHVSGECIGLGIPTW